MAYVIWGLDPADFAGLFAANEAERLAKIVMATTDNGFCCRVSLQDATTGERVALVHRVSNDVAEPFRMGRANCFRDHAKPAETARDVLPVMLDRRTLGLRGFDGGGVLRGAVPAQPSQGDSAIRGLFAVPDIAYIHAHNAAYGCFLAAVERCDD